MKNIFQKIQDSALIKDGIVVSLADYVFYGSQFFLSIIVAQKLGVIEFGNFTLAYAIGITLYNSLISTQNVIIKKELIENPGNSSKIMGTFLVLRTLLVIFIVIISMFFSINSFFILLWKISIVKSLEGVLDVYYSYFQAKNKLILYGILRMIYSIFSIIGTFYLISSIPDVQYLYTPYIIASSFVLLGIVLLNKTNKFVFSYLILSQISKEAAPLIVNSAFFSLQSRISIFIVSLSLTKLEFAMFSAGQSIIAAISMVSSSLGFVIYLQILRIKANLNNIFEYCFRYSKIFLLVGIFVCLPFLFFSNQILGLYNRELIIYTPILAIMVVGIPFLYAQSSFGYYFTIVNKQSESVKLNIGFFVFSIPLYFGLTQALGIIGAGIAFLVHQVIWYFILYIYAKKMGI